MIRFKYFDEDVKQIQNLIIKKAMKAKVTFTYEFYQSDII